MRAVVYTGEGIEVSKDVEVRTPRPTEIKVKIGAAGLCHSDLSVIERVIEYPAPAVLGHEGAGVVEEVGSAVTEVKPGDHVVLATLANCGRCSACARGIPTQCRASLGRISKVFTVGDTPAYNFAGTSVFSEYTVVQAVQAIKIPDDISFNVACLIGCGVLTGVGAALNRANIQPGQSVAVFGIGGIGLNVIQGARIAGAGRIIAVDLLPEKETLARQFGATDFISSQPAGGGGSETAEVPPVDWAFECVGHPAVVRRAVRLPRLGRHMRRPRRAAARRRSQHSDQPTGLRRPRHHRLPVRLGPAAPRRPARWSTSTGAGSCCSTNSCPARIRSKTSSSPSPTSSPAHSREEY